MSYSRQEVMGRALHFATKNGRVLEEELGFGVHGMVWSTDQQSVIKVHGSENGMNSVLRAFVWQLTGVVS